MPRQPSPCPAAPAAACSPLPPRSPPATLAPPVLAQKAIEWRYGHMNPPNSAAGMQAQWLAEEIAKRTGGSIKVTVYPSSQLGKLQELAEAVSTGTIALSHTVAASARCTSRSRRSIRPTSTATSTT
ncbi:MAG: hypothetical protein U1F25_18795 [Rubrivivax sp.]